MYYSPVRHSIVNYRVRLACIRHAASVHPEPGSNSPLYLLQLCVCLALMLFCFILLDIDVVFLILSILFSFQ